MSEQPENKPTGEMIDGYLLTGDEETAEVHGDSIFIPAAWREQLGIVGDDDG